MTIGSTAKTYQLLLHVIVPLLLLVVGYTLALPAVIDVAVGAICGTDECSEVILLSGALATISGVGTALITPWIGSLSDRYGRKPFLVLSFVMTTLPHAVLAVSVSKTGVLTYYSVKCVADMFLLGVLFCLLYAYVGDQLPDNEQAIGMGALTGTMSIGLLIGTAISRFIPEHAIFQAAVAVELLSILCCIMFVPGGRNPKRKDSEVGQMEKSLGGAPGDMTVPLLLHSRSTVRETIGFIQENRILLFVCIISFMNTMAEMGVQSSLLFVLKGNFHFAKDQFSELIFIAGICAMASMLVFLPVLIQVMSVQKVLVVALFFETLHVFIYGLAWAPWAAYLSASMSCFSAMVNPVIGSIVSRSATPDEQGKLQGMVVGLKSVATAVSPLVLSPLTALFLSDRAPFDCPGFSIVVTGFLVLIGLVLAILMPQLPPPRLEVIYQSYSIPGDDEGVDCSPVDILPTTMLASDSLLP